MVESTIFVTKELRAAWPKQAAVWARQFPRLFDADDLRLTRSQPRNHFSEWFAAIHLFQASGVRSLVQKYLFDDAHPRKAEALRAVLTLEQRNRLRSLCNRNGCQPPDLLLFDARNRLAGFAEVKGPGDRLKPSQKRLLPDLELSFGVPAQVIHVRVVAG